MLKMVRDPNSSRVYLLGGYSKDGDRHSSSLSGDVGGVLGSWARAGPVGHVGRCLLGMGTAHGTCCVLIVSRDIGEVRETMPEEDR